MIYYPLATLMSFGIKDILIITAPQDKESFEKLLGDGKNYGCNFVYKIQEVPNGLAEAFIIGKDFIGSDSVCLILGDNLFHGIDFDEIISGCQTAQLERRLDGGVGRARARVPGDPLPELARRPRQPRRGAAL